MESAGRAGAEGAGAEGAAAEGIDRALPTGPPLGLEATYAALPERFRARVAPTPVAAPSLLRVNGVLAEALGLDPDLLASDAGVEMLAGNRLPEDAVPVAMAYAGHQFGQFVPSLGDGRAMLLGEVVDRAGIRWDLHLKGAGRTPFSRMGDGRAPMGPVIREYVLSEAMAGLGIPTTRSLAMVATGEPVPRPQRLEPGAVLARVATSHVRVGTFEYFACRGDVDGVRRLADYVIERLWPDAAGAELPVRMLLDDVIRRQAELVARWMEVGFVHGVMNTDNMSIAGETIDYGPCAFLDAYHPDTVYSSIDHGGRYAFGRQPSIGLWNLARFAETLLPLLDEREETAIERAREALEAYPRLYEKAIEAELARKLGLGELRPGDAELAHDLLERMAAQQADFTLTFRGLAEMAGDPDAGGDAVRERFADPQAFDAWAARWRARLAQDGSDPAARRDAMRRANPAFIPRNHRVAQAIDAAVLDGDLRPLDALLAVVTRPYEDHPEHADLAQPPAPHERVVQTFCGT